MTLEILVTALAKGAAGKFAAYPLNTILGYLIDQVTTQEVKLSGFERKLDQHMTNPFRVGKVYLEEARNAPDGDRKRAHLYKALDEFIRVSQVDLPEYPMLPIQAQFYVGVCYDLLSDQRNALRWYKKSFQLNDRILQVDRLLQDTRQSRDDFRKRLEENQSSAEKTLGGALDKVFGGLDWLNDSVLNRKESLANENARVRFQATIREAKEFSKFLADLLASRQT